jgi:hypothetical protein
LTKLSKGGDSNGKEKSKEKSKEKEKIIFLKAFSLFGLDLNQISD